MSEMAERYQPQEVEEKIYQWWESSGYFKTSDQSTKPPFCIILPPPNVTGFLHLGHALDHTIQDCLIRWKRMNGFNALWLPGTDHAGIATQAVVEKELKKQGVTRHQLGREKFVEKVWEWKHQYGDRIYKQMRRLGDSCDWDRACFTLDDGVSKAVRKVFVSLYKKGLIYKGKRLVNWSGPLETAISDLEVEHRQVKGSIFHIKYFLEDKSSFLTVATTRPETLLGDVAICVHPEDSRYQSLIGKSVLLPLLERKIPIISDPYVDKEFGSGVLKITPAHDFNDYKIGKAHQLPLINILTRKCELNENAGPYQGLKIPEARKKILEDLKAQDLLEKEEPHVHSVGHCSRSGAIAEPFLSDQWFVQMDKLAIPAKRVVESGTVRLEPDSWTKVYLHWMNIIEDWCISRQLWWGHRIPAWYCQDCSRITVAETDPTSCSECKSTHLKQEDDVLDTWFSSALWPFSTLGWPNETEALKTFYPTNVLVTGHDILFFWVARMMISGLEFLKDVPFRHVYLHGIIRDAQGRKMSKSLGNSLDPVEMIDKHGADAVRFSMLAHIHSGKDMKFSEQRTEGYRNFMNKVWNATRYSLGVLKDFAPPPEMEKAIPNKNQISIYDQWIVKKLEATEKEVEEALEQFKFSEASMALYQFVWYEFCDWYIEFTKPIMNDSQSPFRQGTQLVLAQLLNRICRLLHPFTPFISEELYQKLPIKGKACVVDQYPNTRNDKAFLSLGSADSAYEVDVIKEIISSVRNIRGENRISPAEKISVRLSPSDAKSKTVIERNQTSIVSLARIGNLQIGDSGSLKKCAVAIASAGDSRTKVIVPLEGLVDLKEEVRRIEKLIEKLEKETASLTGRLSNPNFRANANEDVVKADEDQLAENQKQLELHVDSLARLGD